LYRHILLPLDGSSSSKKAAIECIQVAKCLGASIRAIQIIRPPLFFEDEAPQDLRREVEARFEALAQPGAHGPLAELQRYAEENGVEWTTTVMLGVKPYRDIVDHAMKAGCDLIVMGSHRRSGFHAWLHGSQTRKVLSRCHIPVLVLHAT
jgi:nucleotide-binding universal stress UspA family protein